MYDVSVLRLNENQFNIELKHYYKNGTLYEIIFELDFVELQFV